MWLPIPRLRFPMKVDVKNPRLICLFLVVQVLTFIFFSIMFWLLDLWAARTAVGRYIYPMLAVNTLSYQEQLQEVWADRSQKPFCTSPGRFDYRWDEEGLLTYSNHTCLPLCRANESGFHHKCVHLAETYMAQNVDQVFLTTQFQDTILPVGEDRPPVAKRNHFIPTAEGLVVSIRFSYEVPIPPRLQLPAWTQADFHQTLISGSSTRDVVTVVLDADGSLWRKFLPGEDIQFSIPTLLDLAGHPELLNTPQPHLGRNMLPGAAIPDGPIARLTGFGLEFGLECFDKQYVTVPGHDGFQCLLRVNKFMPGWFAVEQSDLLDEDGHHRHRLSHGIRVNVRTGGYFRFFSFAGMLRFSTYMIVLMSLPSRFVLFVAVSCLGHLSMMYKKVLFHDFDIYEKVGGFATRLMSSSAAFVLLDDTQGNGISKHRMHERLSSAASARASTYSSDNEVIGRFVDYCWHSAVKERNHLRASSLQEMITHVSGEISEVLKPRRKSQVDDIHLDLEHFSKACTNNEEIPFEVLVGMFSKNRKREFLERIFTPSNVSRYLRDDESEGDDEEESAGDDDEAESETSGASMASKATPVSVVDSGGESDPPVLVTRKKGRTRTLESKTRRSGGSAVSTGAESDAPVLVTRKTGRARTLEQKKLEVDSDHARIQSLENSLFSLEGRLKKLLEELDLRLSNLECTVKDGLGGVESRTQSLEKQAEQAAELLEKRHSDALEKLERRLEEHNQAVAETVAESVAEAMEAQPLLARLPDFEAQLNDLVQLYRQIQPGLLEPGGDQDELNYLDEGVEMPQVSGGTVVGLGSVYDYHGTAYHEDWNADPEIVPNGEIAELQPVSYAAFHDMFAGSARSSPRAAGWSPRSSPRATQVSWSPHCSPRAAQARGSEWHHSAGALAGHLDTSTPAAVPRHRGSVGLQRLGRALSPSTLRRLGP